MAKSQVFFTNLRTNPHSNLLDKLERLVARAGMLDMPLKDSFVAIKIHFGEPGNLAYIRPNFAARLAQVLRKAGAKPFLTDANTLYSGRRANAVDHLQSAMENGFNPISADCNVIIADGLKGTEQVEIPIGGEYCKAPKIGAAVANADVVVSMTHFKGHEQAGFGGALKNLGMGAASVAGKLELHSNSQPKVNEDKCIGCGQCVALCQFDGAVLASWDTSERLNYKIAEYTKAVIKDKPNFHISFIMNVSPECDCWNHNDAAVVADMGILASFDPVALDQACADMVKAAPALPTDNRLHDGHSHETMAGQDKFRVMHPDTDWEAGLEHAVKIGIGSRDYDLINV